ncbi:MAG: hypothetical protein A3K19_30610 [Lentisphaerae bacterium RIFOXYB12_FULL_65_16]|nr:MAG: hypothetical protein A3K18_23385 [Lentisphaerae bacterium RIFOXYA12_64_32]OGV92155.1 MAG: hypothetical protein A3K19_30610 [Lentisphaerae bacterium RIFOXYB12_FULL_65_16]
MVVWTDYMKFRARLRGFDLAEIERIVRSGEERYIDTVSGRRVVVGRHGRLRVVIPYEETAGEVIPITVHVTSRQQINFRIRSGRYAHE